MKAKLLVSTAFLAASVSLSAQKNATITVHACLLYTSPSPRD